MLDVSQRLSISSWIDHNNLVDDCRLLTLISFLFVSSLFILLSIWIQMGSFSEYSSPSQIIPYLRKFFSFFVSLYSVLVILSLLFTWFLHILIIDVYHHNIMEVVVHPDSGAIELIGSMLMLVPIFLFPLLFISLFRNLASFNSK